MIMMPYIPILDKYSHMNNPYIVHLLNEQQNLADFRAKSYILDPR